MMMKISVVCTGDELLDGRITDQNSGSMVQFAGMHEAEVVSIRIVRDTRDAVLGALNDAVADEGVGLVIVSGGLGPTEDDLTREVAAAWAGCALVLDDMTLEQMKERFRARGAHFTENNARQAYFPALAKILRTEVGTAAGFELVKAGVRVLFFPGVPREFRWFLETYVVPILDESAASGVRLHTKYGFHGVGESELAEKLGDIGEIAAEVGGRVSYRAAYPLIEVALSALEPSGLERLQKRVLERAGAWLISEGDETLVARVGRLLMAEQATVTVAESCTGGGLGAALTEVSGSSAWFERGYITYSNRSKIEELGVHPDALATHGAVSREVVCQMAIGARRRAGADYALAISGIAGPSGGSPEKPVGTVHIALSSARGTWHRHMIYVQRDREQVRQASVYTALSLLLWMLEGRLTQHRVDGPFEDTDFILGNSSVEASKGS